MSGPLSEVMLIESLPHEDLDDGLPTDVQFTSSKIQFTEHVLCEVHIHSLYRRHHSTCVGKVARNVLTTLRPLCNRFGRDRVPGLRSFLHKVFALKITEYSSPFTHPIALNCSGMSERQSR